MMTRRLETGGLPGTDPLPASYAGDGYRIATAVAICESLSLPDFNAIWSAGASIGTMNKEFAIENDVRLADLVERAEHGDSVALTRDGAVVARIVPNVVKAGDGDNPAEAMRRIFEIGDGVSLGGLRFKDLINEGRKY